MATVQFSARCLYDKPSGNMVQFHSDAIPAPAEGVVYFTAPSGVRWYVDGYGNACIMDACAAGQTDWVRFAYVIG